MAAVVISVPLPEDGKVNISYKPSSLPLLGFVVFRLLFPAPFP